MEDYIMWTEVIAIVLSIIFIGGSSFGAENLLNVFSWVIDIPSLVAILILSIPILVRKGMWKDFTRTFKMMNKKYSCSIADMKRSQDAIEFAQKQIMYAGIITFILGVIAICGHIDDLSAVGPNMAVAIISVLYTAFLELLLLPVQVEIKGRIIDYMEGE